MTRPDFYAIVLHDDSMKLEFGVPASELLPLGDKQTQDEFKKELECVG